MRHRNRGTGGNLGIIGIFLFSQYFWWILLLVVLLSIPWWVYLILGTIAALLVITHVFTDNTNKEGYKDENN